MTQHIGIVGCSAEGAALCYKTICNEGADFLGAHNHPEISLHTPPLIHYVRCLDAGDLEGVGDLMLSSAHKLAAAGADFLICPDNTIHQAFSHVTARSPLPWLHIAEIVAEEAHAKGYQNIGILGTKWLVESPVYPEKLNDRKLTFLRPLEEECREINRIIMEELVNGIFKPEGIAYHQQVITHLKKRGCDAVILGCTEIPLILNDDISALPTLDSARLLARAALRRAIH